MIMHTKFNAKPMKPISYNDTIAAVATAAGRSGIGIVRISGDDALSILTGIFVPSEKSGSARGSNSYTAKGFKSHTLRYGYISDGDEMLDEVMAVYMKAPRSYTREDVAEISCHGGAASVTRVLDLVLKRGARPAENGEFTRRAFMNGRIDLSQAEAVMELINAQTEMSAKAALVRLGGGLAAIVKRISGEILTLLAHIEVSIDYPEHESETYNKTLIKKKSSDILTEIDSLLATSEIGRILTSGIEAVIAGRPNVGKSSLLNALLGEDRAIVTATPGTTRDPISESIDLRGVPLKLTDTAGIRDSSDEIESIGVKRSRKKLETADLALFVIDGSEALKREDLEIYEEVGRLRHIILINKADLGVTADVSALNARPENIFEISALNRSGLESVYEKIRSMFISGEIEPNSDVLVSGVRCKNALINAGKSLRNAVLAIDNGLTEDLFAIDLRDCYDYLCEITGEALDDELLDKIFGEFCLGK